MLTHLFSLLIHLSRYGLRIIVNNTLEIVKPILEKRFTQWTDKTTFSDGDTVHLSQNNTRPSRDSRGGSVHGSSRCKRSDVDGDATDDNDDLLSERSYANTNGNGTGVGCHRGEPRYRSVDWETGVGCVVCERLVDAGNGRTKKTEAEKQFELTSYASTFDDFNEIIIIWGYTILFVVVFPLAPLLSLLNNFVEVRVDAKKLLSFTQRPTPRQVGDIGAWKSVFTVITGISSTYSAASLCSLHPRFVTLVVLIFFCLCYPRLSSIAQTSDDITHSSAFRVAHRFSRRTNETVVSNVACVVFEMDFFDDYSDAARIRIFLLVEHGMFLFLILLAFALPDVPEHVKTQARRQQYVEKCLVSGAGDIAEVGDDEADLELYQMMREEEEWRLNMQDAVEGRGEYDDDGAFATADYGAASAAASARTSFNVPGAVNEP
jgi:hypothetical protein